MFAPRIWLGSLAWGYLYNPVPALFPGGGGSSGSWKIRGSSKDFHATEMRVCELSCGPETDLRTFGFLFQLAAGVKGKGISKSKCGGWSFRQSVWRCELTAKALMTGPEVPISSTGWVVFIKEKPKVLGLLHENTSVLELSSTTGKFHEVILASTKMPKQP